jgi:hypothetical protein
MTHSSVLTWVTQTEQWCNTLISTDNTDSENGDLIDVKLLIMWEDSVVRYLVTTKFLNFIKGALDITVVTVENIYKYTVCRNKTLWVKGKQ